MSGIRPSGFCCRCDCTIALADDAGTRDGAGEFRHDRFSQ